MVQLLIDAILSYHLNPATCGVAKFNRRLARELGVPMRSLTEAKQCQHPLFSIKFAEIEWARIFVREPFSLFLHDWQNSAGPWIQRAERIYAANGVIAEQIRPIRPDVVDAWCPSTIEGNAHRGRINVLTFGMAHKLQIARYEKLKALLDGTGEDYTVSVSTAVHEGSPWEETAQVGEALRLLFGTRLRMLGYLADDALVRELRDCTAVALFFDPALRANNTTAFAAIDAGRPVVTNLDASSPRTVGAWDIDTFQVWPPFLEFAARVSALVPHGFTWPALIEKIQCAK